MTIQLKILVGLSSDVVRLRSLRYKYETNRAIKAYALWTYLKNQTDAGIIHNAGKQLESFLEELKISRATFYNYLNYAQDIGLITRTNFGKTLRLASYQFVMDELLITEKKFITINYDLTNTKQKIEHIFDCLEHHENKQKQQLAQESKITKNPIVRSAFQLYSLKQGKRDLPFNMDNLSITRHELFEKGSAESIYAPLMYVVNPDYYRNSSTIANARKYKSPRLVTYCKIKLERAGLITVQRTSNPVCKYNKNSVEGMERGKNENAVTFYNPKEKKKTWFLPDKITINPVLFAENQKTANARHSDEV